MAKKKITLEEITPHILVVSILRQEADALVERVTDRLIKEAKLSEMIAKEFALCFASNKESEISRQEAIIEKRFGIKKT